MTSPAARDVLKRAVVSESDSPAARDVLKRAVVSEPDTSSSVTSVSVSVGVGVDVDDRDDLSAVEPAVDTVLCHTR